MDVSVVGGGYVGITLGTCLASLGHEITIVDTDETQVRAIQDGRAPIHETGIQDLVDEHGDRIAATSSYESVADTEVTFVCLPTPSKADGAIDTSIVEAGAEAIGEAIAGKTDHHTVVTKSTVIPSTTDEVIAPAIAAASGRKRGRGFDVAMNPEFLREGSAVADFLDPDKIVLGTDTDRVTEQLRTLYADLLDDTTVVETGIREAEMIKYANNAFLAAKVSLVNDLANVCKELGVDSHEVLAAVGLDERISSAFMRPGLGWGGSCFPKDVDAIRAAARTEGYTTTMLDAAVETNEGQPARLVDLLGRHVEIEGARIALLGLSFKPGTDDVRNSRAFDLVDLLSERGAAVVAYDPVATDAFAERRPDVTYADSADAALADADAAVVATAWDEFAAADYAGMRRSVVVDGRGIDVDRDALDVYEGLCW